MNKVYRKVYGNELSKESKKLFYLLAKKQGLNDKDISAGLDSKIRDLDDLHDELGFRRCEHGGCQEFFNEGFLTEDDMTYCSEECAEEMNPQIVEEDYGDFVFFTEWEPETYPVY